MTLKLYAFPWGLYPRRVLIYLEEKGKTGIELVQVDMVAGENRAPWFLRINPAGTVPCQSASNSFQVTASNSFQLVSVVSAAVYGV